MKIFTTQQIKEAEESTIKKQGITFLDLMERAGTAVFNWLHERLQGNPVQIHVFCGVGNNGGDGMVVARHLLTHGYTVKVYVVNYSEKRSELFLDNLERVKELKHWPSILHDGDELPTIGADDVVIDCIFGNGLHRTPASWIASLIQHINNSKAFTLAVDIPSGLYTDKVPEDEKAVIYANHTLSFEFPKLTFFLTQTAKYTNNWELLPIGVDSEYVFQTKTSTVLVTKNDVLSLYQPRQKFSHKGTYGHVLVVGGSYGKIGAPILSTKAALHVGAGLVSAFVPKCGYQIVQTAIPEAMVKTCMHEEYISEIQVDFNPTAIAIGVGLGTKDVTKNGFTKFLETNTLPLVVDADGINILSEEPQLLAVLPKDTVLTPHPKEFKRLVGEWTDDIDKIEKAKAFSKQYNVILVLKDAHTIVVYQEELYINTTGNPGMATAGSGDALTGMIAGLIAQQYTPLQAAIFGVYLHGSAGDIAVQTEGYQALTAGILIEHIGKAYLQLFAKEEPPQAKL